MDATVSIGIQPHNAPPAAVWNSGGEAYEEISRGISDSLEHCVQRLSPKPGERILDLSTGTGWTSRLVARAGATVAGVDIADGLLEVARARARADGLSITYQVGDAEALPFEDGAFDAVVSTHGVMFASQPERAAAGLARVCRTGGRIALTTWHADGNVFGMFQVMRRYMAVPQNPATPSPFAWGRTERIQELLADAFALSFEEGVSYYRESNGEAAWATFSRGYGPTCTLAAALDADRRQALRREFIAFHEEFRAGQGIIVPRRYWLTTGQRLGQ